jgi:rhamnose utilization protein RhaD (predicted bifunctional aldolase and dehydrogenase)
MDKPLAELVKISNAVGKRSWLVLGSFGNTSVKTTDGKYMYIKASGTALKDMTYKAGWRRLKLEPVRAILTDKTIAGMDADAREAKVAKGLLAACDDKFCRGARGRNKPSIESGFHSTLDRFVIHLHPVAVLAYVCAKKGRTKLETLFREEKFPPLWVPYTNSGYTLAKKIEKFAGLYRTHYDRGPGIIFLQNHGLVVSAKSSNAALGLVRKMVDICNSKLKQQKPGKISRANSGQTGEVASVIRKAFLQVMGKHISVRHFIDESIAGFLQRKDAGRLCSARAVTPDELVYAHGPAMWLAEFDRQAIHIKLKRLHRDGRQLPTAFLIRPLGLFIVGGKKQLPFLKDVVTTYLSVRALAAGLGGIHPLNKRQREFITKWES